MSDGASGASGRVAASDSESGWKGVVSVREEKVRVVEGGGGKTEKEGVTFLAESATLNGDRQMKGKEGDRPIKSDAEIKEIGGEGSGDVVVLEDIRAKSLIPELVSNDGVLGKGKAADQSTRVSRREGCLRLSEIKAGFEPFC
ncbi:hypothetical protein Salat_2106000 [Sesamum alatum]|uniref:Uncharacterized protein n=1 Tax=Sesamum alatum TaxID=300844 RepID=A0AAE1Y0T8_9LAMI|nr:hypothetical protein Salat_2106000 [Sesamum alatum]